MSKAEVILKDKKNIYFSDYNDNRIKQLNFMSYEISGDIHEFFANMLLANNKILSYLNSDSKRLGLNPLKGLLADKIKHLKTQLRQNDGICPELRGN